MNEDYYCKNTDDYYNHETKMFNIYKQSPELAIEPYVTKKNGAVFLDIAGGGGSYSLALKERYPNSKFIVMDFLEQAVNAGKKLSADLKLNVDFINGYATKIPLDDSSVDYVIMRKAIQYVYPIDQCLSEIYRTLKPKGKLFIIKHINFPWYLIYHLIRDLNFDFISKKGSYIHLKYWLSSTKITKLLKKHRFSKTQIIPTDFMMKNITNLKPDWLKKILTPCAVKPFIIGEK